MKIFLRFFIASLIGIMFFLYAPFVRADEACPDGKVCVSKEDMKVFIQAATEKRCLVSTQPKLTADPVIVIVDKQGRIYASGNDPKPFTVQMDWCNYSLTAKGQTSITAAEHVEPNWGFRFRPKATVGILGTELLSGAKIQNTIDGGALFEPFFYHFVNVNGYVGLRSFGLGLGWDLTKNFGVATLVNLTWSTWRTNPYLGFYFSFL